MINLLQSGDYIAPGEGPNAVASVVLEEAGEIQDFGSSSPVIIKLPYFFSFVVFLHCYSLLYQSVIMSHPATKWLIFNGDLCWIS